MCRGGAGPELAAVVTGMSSIQRWVCSLVNGHVFSCFPLPEVKRAIMYQALYRKYRPKTFDDVVGQEHITETLKKQVETGRLSHAYLFIGTRGTGKTTCAKILAKAVNCEHPVNGNPCNQCAACRGIDDGSILDVVEIDAASNNRVEDVRALRDEAVFSPANVNKRVYIIDEVHMLSNSAFNALLKILEEPPAHLMFILATTELHKVPATILSRCQRHSFKRIPVDTIAARLNYVAQQERLDLQPDAAALLARMADGGMRDALTLLDQCSGSDVITTEAVISAMGLAGNLRTARLLQSIADGDTAKTLEQFRSLWLDGKDPAALLDELSMLQRDLLMQAAARRPGAALRRIRQRNAAFALRRLHLGAAAGKPAEHSGRAHRHGGAAQPAHRGGALSDPALSAGAVRRCADAVRTCGQARTGRAQRGHSGSDSSRSGKTGPCPAAGARTEIEPGAGSTAQTGAKTGI